MTIDFAREIVEAMAHGRWANDILELPNGGFHVLTRDEVIQALCVVVHACGMRPVSDDELRGQYQRMVDRLGSGAVKAHVE